MSPSAAIHPEPPGRSDSKPGQGYANADEVLEHYLSTTNYFQQTVLSAKTAIRSVWKRQVFACGAEATKDALKSYWTNIGVVSALLLSISYSSSVSPITSDDPDMENACRAVTVLSGTSLIMSLAVIVVAVIYLIEIDNCTTERDLGDFITSNAWVIDSLTGLFTSSVVLLFGSAIGSMYITYERTEFIIVAAVAGIVVLFGIVFASIVAGHNRFRLWARYDSPHGRALLERVQQEESRELRALKDELQYQVLQLRQLRELAELKELKDRLEGKCAV